MYKVECTMYNDGPKSNNYNKHNTLSSLEEAKRAERK